MNASYRAKYAQLKQDILGDGIKEGKLEAFKKLSASLFGRDSLVFDDVPEKLLIKDMPAVMFLWAEKGSIVADPEDLRFIGEFILVVAYTDTIRIIGNYKKGAWRIFDTDFATTWKSQTEINIVASSPSYQKQEVIRLERTEDPTTSDCWIEYSPESGLSFVVGTNV